MRKSMAVKAVKTKEIKKESPSEETYTVNLPKFSKMSLSGFTFGNHKINYTPILVLLLIIESVFLGSFYTQVQDLKGGGTGNTAIAAGTQAVAQPGTTTAPVVAKV